MRQARCHGIRRVGPQQISEREHAEASASFLQEVATIRKPLKSPAMRGRDAHVIRMGARTACPLESRLADKLSALLYVGLVDINEFVHGEDGLAEIGETALLEKRRCSIQFGVGRHSIQCELPSQTNLGSRLGTSIFGQPPREIFRPRAYELIV